MSVTVISGLVLILAVLLFGLGLLLLILGIIQKKPRQWVSGIFISVFSMIFCIVGIVWLIAIVADKSDSKPSHDYEVATPYDNNNENIDGGAAQDPDELNTYDEGYITGFIQDADQSLIHIRVISDPVLKDLGISVNKIDRIPSTGNKTIPLNIVFSKKFKGELQLILYSSDNEEVGKSLVQISQNENSTFTVKFLFDKETNFLKTEYARLKSSY